MPEHLILHGINIESLVENGRIPRLVEDWAAGPFCIIPPEGIDIESELTVEQVGQFEEGRYGDILFLTPDETDQLRFLLLAIGNVA